MVVKCQLIADSWCLYSCGGAGRELQVHEYGSSPAGGS